MPVVVGILPDYNSLSKLTDALKAAQLDLGDLIVVADDMPEGGVITSGVDFRLSGEPDTANLTSSIGIITSSGGTEVPGLSGTQSIGMIGEHTGDALSDLNVPDTRIDDYQEALEEGRCVVGFPTADVDKLKAIFASSGVNPVEVF